MNINSSVPTGEQTETAIVDPGWVSVPALKQYLDQADAAGIAWLPMLSELGIDPELLADNSRRIRGERLQQLLQKLIPASQDSCFGLHTSAFIKPASYSVLGYIAMNCATLGDALSRVPIYEKIVGDMGVTRIQPGPSETRVIWHCQFSDALVRRHITENVLASWTRYARWITGQHQINPSSIWFEHDAPPTLAQRMDYEAIFQCPVHFSQACSAVILPTHYLSAPIVQADAPLLAALEDHAIKVLHDIDKGESTTHQVRNLLRLMLQHTLPRKEVIAEKLGMNSRTLQRRLNEEGSGYQELLVELRYELARNYLCNSALGLSEISQRLGFGEPSSFQRSFKQWSGMTPGAFRLQAHSAELKNCATGDR